ncbi:MAG: aspartate-semialdehyde dehydrogenase [Ignavibacteriaceae bacterium]|nr:aspartate-semialdehyde dehydrogenase [Ignavibacteriaceae bacterium]
MKNKIKVGILGATGSVGQKFIELLENHPYFELNEVCASEQSAGKKYSEKVKWIQSTPLNKIAGSLTIKKCTPDLESQVVFSALDSSIAGEIESEFATKGYHVISNSKNHRWDEDVPLLIPEVNYEHLELLKSQKYEGSIVTNPNCSTIGLVLSLKPLEKFEIESVNVVTMQAISGAGFPGVPSMSILDNVIPFISGEEEKLETEPLKILGKIDNGMVVNSKMNISAQCNRVHVLDGHLEVVQVKFKNKPSKHELIESWKSFRSLPQQLNLPFAPEIPTRYFEEDDLPQPKLQRSIDKGMAVSIGRLRDCSLFDYKFVIISHNTIRGAAGGSILCAELMHEKGLI